MKKDEVKIIPLGGLDKIGMNITAFETDEDIIIVDCGMSFPSEDMLGIDYVIPDITYLIYNRERVRAFFITHGHEDHIGALPYVLKQLNVPIYATKLTMGIIEGKLEEAELMDVTKRNVVKYGDIIETGDFKVEFIRTNHSIADAAALAITTPAGVIVHTGDFKVDYTPVYGEPIDLKRFAELGNEGVLAVMCDSTNVVRPGFTMSERAVGDRIDKIFADHPKNRIIIATFASNVDRVQEIVNAAQKYNRKVIIEGRSMVGIFDIAQKLGYLEVPDNIMVDIEEIGNYTDEQICLITTGSQGEAMAALSRMASSAHKKVSIFPGDTIIFSSNPIPGNEKAVTKVINDLYDKDAEVIFENTHVSGHACQEEIKLIYTLTKPKYAIPVHGEVRHLKEHAKLCKSLGMDNEHIFVLHSGDVLKLSPKKGKIVDKVVAGEVMVDGLGVGDVGNIVLRDRQSLSENGIMIVVMTLERYGSRILAGPDIVSRGFVYVRESEDLIYEAQTVVREALERCLGSGVNDWGRIKTVIRDTLSEFLWKKIKRSPMIIPIIMEVD